MVTEALHGAIDFILSKEAVLYRAADSREYPLSQVADCVCTLELTDLKFQNKKMEKQLRQLIQVSAHDVSACA